jgi:hypothetical protein
MLRDRFRDNGGVDGGTVDSAIRFYLSGLKEAGVKFSDHLNMRQRAPKGSGTRTRHSGAGNRGKADGAGVDDSELNTPNGTIEVALNVIGLAGSVYLPEDVTQEQWDAISGYVKMLIGYRQQAQKPKATA